MTKKIFAGALAGLMVLSSASALACDKDSFVGYDIADSLGRYAKIYYCPEIGKATIKKDGKVQYASTVEWVHAFYEAEYPHKEVQTLVLDGTNTGMTRYSGNYANAAVELRPDFWEAKAPYDVYHRIYSSLEGGAFKPSTIVGYAGKQADVKVSKPIVGFDKYVIADGVAQDYTAVYGQLAGQVKGDPLNGTLDSLVATYYSLVTDPVTGEFTKAFMEGEEAAWIYDIFYDAIPQYTWEVLEGPDYYNGGTETVVPMQVLADKLDEIVKGKATWAEFHPGYYDNTIAEVTNPSQDVKWVTVGYEAEFPYRIYQVLQVNGVKLDGSLIGGPALGQTKVGEEVVATYDTSLLDGVDHARIYDLNTITARPDTADYDLTEITTETENLAKHINVPAYIFDEDVIKLTKDVMVDNTVRLPNVFRYTGGVAHPVVEWKVVWPEAEYPYTVYEEKYLDGKATGILRSTETTASAIPEIYKPTPDVGNGLRVLRVTLTGDNIQDSCLHDTLIADGYKFIVNGVGVAYYKLPEVLYPGHAFAGSQSFSFGPGGIYTTEVVEADFAEAQKALFNK